MNTQAIANLLDNSMKVIYARFYRDLPIRIWMRDRNEIHKSLSRYGHECCKRGWDLPVNEISNDLLAVLRKMTPPDHQWLPKYLEACVDRHVRSRAEELSELAKRGTVDRVVSNLKQSLVPGDVIVREKTPVEVLSDLYVAQSKIRRSRHIKSDQRKADKTQMKLL